MNVKTVRRVNYGFGDVLPIGEYRVEHFSPWGPAIDWQNSLGHGVIVHWDAIEGGRAAVERRLAEGEHAGDEVRRNRAGGLIC